MTDPNPQDLFEAYNLVIAFAEARTRLMMFNDDVSLESVESIIEAMMEFGEKHGVVSGT